MKGLSRALQHAFEIEVAFEIEACELPELTLEQSDLLRRKVRRRFTDCYLKGTSKLQMVVHRKFV
jgi:hypothetical protein